MSSGTALSPENYAKIMGLADQLQTQFISKEGPFPVGLEVVKGVAVRTFLTGPRTLRDYFETYETKFADNTFLVYDQERLTFAEVGRLADAFGAGLASEFGVKKGDRVAIFARNWPEWCIGFIAATKMGAVAVPLNSWWKTDELAYGLKNSGANVIICDAQRHKIAHPCLAKLGVNAVLIRDGPFAPAQGYKALPWSAVVAAGQGKAKVQFPLDRDDMCCLMYTSGSTGNPKGVVQSHRGVTDQMHMAVFGAALGEKIMSIAMPDAPKETLQQSAICPVPLFHVTASHHLFLSCYGKGAKMTIMAKWDAGKALELIEREQATGWTGVPTMLQDMMEHPDFATRDLSSLKSVGAGGAPTPRSQVIKVNKAFKMVGRPGQGYGLTETNGAVATINGDTYVLHPASTGKAFCIVEAKCVDLETGEEVKRGERGELLVRSSLVMTEYWNNPTATAAAMTPDRFFRTGDICVMDEEGFITIVDRAKQIIIRGGENISCAEVEEAIHGHAAVMEVSVFGLPDPRLGEKVAAMVMVKPGATLTAKEVSATAAAALAKFKVPAACDVYLTTKSLPRGATGKIQKREIKESVMKAIKAKL